MDGDEALGAMRPHAPTCPPDRAVAEDGAGTGRPPEAAALIRARGLFLTRAGRAILLGVDIDIERRDVCLDDLDAVRHWAHLAGA